MAEEKIQDTEDTSTIMSIDSCPNGIRLIDMTEDDMVVNVTKQYLEDIDPNVICDTTQLKSDLLFIVDTFIEDHNQHHKGNKWKKRSTLYPIQIAMILMKLHTIRMVKMFEDGCGGESSNMLLAIYQESGKNEGLYMAQDRELKKLIQKWNKSITQMEMKQVIEYLENNSEVVTRSDSPTLIAVQNGIFDFETKRLDAFSPDIVFTSKCRVRYNPCATDPVVIHNDEDGSDWEIGEWLDDMFDYDPDIVEVIWQILSALVRPNVKWEKCIWFYSTKGNNGKGTLCELMKNLVGKDMCASIKIADFKK